MELKMVGSGTVNATDDIFGREFNEALVHQVVVAYQANARIGSRAQKDRGAVNHSTKKPWRQKGTGRARAGMTSSPLWRGGGKIFPNSPDENFTHKVNRKMYRAGLCSILSQLAREDRLRVVDAFVVDAPKTTRRTMDRPAEPAAATWIWRCRGDRTGRRSAWEAPSDA